MDEEECSGHEPDWDTIQIATVVSDEGLPVVDVNCKHCGLSGSFILEVHEDNINWELFS